MCCTPKFAYGILNRGHVLDTNSPTTTQSRRTRAFGAPAAYLRPRAFHRPWFVMCCAPLFAVYNNRQKQKANVVNEERSEPTPYAFKCLPGLATVVIFCVGPAYATQK